MCCNVEDVGSTAHLTRAEGATTHLVACSTLTTSRHSVSAVRPSGSVGRQWGRLRYRQRWVILPTPGASEAGLGRCVWCCEVTSSLFCSVTLPESPLLLRIIALYIDEGRKANHSQNTPDEWRRCHCGLFVQRGCMPRVQCSRRKLHAHPGRSAGCHGDTAHHQPRITGESAICAVLTGPGRPTMIGLRVESLPK
jgi:hypothetical protein